MKKSLVIAAMLAAAALHAQQYQAAREQELKQVDSAIAAGPYSADWTSLAGYRIPGWFRDAKFGIFVHWGVYSVPAFGSEWYSREMYLKGSPEYEYHRAVYGPQDKFGYKDLITQFTASKFNADVWLDLFARAGAHYVVQVAEHCDGFPMYDSSLTGWNAAKMGPKRDVVAEVAKATRAHGLHFGLSSHRAEHWWWYNGASAFPSDVEEAKYSGLYGPAQPTTLPGQDSPADPDPNHLERWLPPSREFLEDWEARSSELVDKYHPELIYFDWWINQPAFTPYLQKFAAYYYDRASHSGIEPVLTYKEYAFPENTAVLDIERGKLDQLRLLPWQSDTSVSINSWGYVRDDHYRTAQSLIGTLVDIVSKNGNLLLNVGPRADGTIPDEIQKVLLQMGDWLRVNGEAIYGTRPWKLYGEGVTNSVSGSLKESAEQPFTPADIRFTARGDILYAISLAYPPNGEMTVRTLYRNTPYLPAPISDVTLLGAPGQLQWRQTSKGLVVQLPAQKPDDLAWVLRIRTTDADQKAEEKR